MTMLRENVRVGETALPADGWSIAGTIRALCRQALVQWDR